MKTNVFISQSGERSRALAEALREFVRTLIQATEPWVSTEIPKGAQWPSELAARLSQAGAGMVCLTPENLAEPWIVFEAGALSRTDKVWTVLLDLQHSHVAPPLGLYQHTTTDKEDIWRMVKSINRTVDFPNDEMNLRRLFERLWPDLHAEIAAIRAMPFLGHSISLPDPTMSAMIGEAVRKNQQLESQIAAASEQLDQLHLRFRHGAASVQEGQRGLELAEVDLQFTAIKALLKKYIRSESEDVYSRYNAIINEIARTEGQLTIVQYMTGSGDWTRLAVLASLSESSVDTVKAFMDQLCAAGVAHSKSDGNSVYYQLKLPNS